MPRRKRGARNRKGRAFPEAQPRPPSGQELWMILAAEELLGRARDVARRIDERMRQLLGPQGPPGPGPGLPERGQTDRANDSGARTGEVGPGQDAG
jgi:hypothetical protein